MYIKAPNKNQRLQQRLSMKVHFHNGSISAPKRTVSIKSPKVLRNHNSLLAGCWSLKDDDRDHGSELLIYLSCWQLSKSTASWVLFFYVRPCLFTAEIFSSWAVTYVVVISWLLVGIFKVYHLIILANCEQVNIIRINFMQVISLVILAINYAVLS